MSDIPQLIIVDINHISIIRDAQTALLT